MFNEERQGVLVVFFIFRFPEAPIVWEGGWGSISPAVPWAAQPGCCSGVLAEGA